MILKSLRTVDFKCLEMAELEFCAKFNCLTGKNGAGKTAVLDAIHYLGMSKGFVHGQDTLNVRNGQEFYAISAVGEKEETECQFLITFKNGKKSFKLNGKEYQRLADHIGFMNVVLVAPSDGELISGGSDSRRRFIDGAISQIKKPYLNDLLGYNRALQQRNALLKQFAERGEFSQATLEVWDMKMAEFGTRIHQARKEFLSELIPLTNELYAQLSGKAEQIGVVYGSQLDEGNFEQLLKDAVHADRAAKHTTVGIHKDDLTLTIHDQPLKRLGSQGQQKTALIALKLAQYQLYKKTTGQVPVLLLDDIFDKLDPLRVGHLLNLVGGEDHGQVFITDTDPNRVSSLLSEQKEVALFNVSEGTVERISE